MDRQRTADFATLDTLRSLTRSGCIEPLDRAAALTLTLEQLTRERDRLAHAAAEAPLCQHRVRHDCSGNG